MVGLPSRPLAMEFVVRGTPATLQSNRRRRGAWKSAVAAAATALGPGPVLTSDVLVDITYVYDLTPAPLDVDNIVKPLADALIGIAFDDDSRMRRVCSGRLDAAGAAILPFATPLLTAALALPGDFVHVTIEVV